MCRSTHFTIHNHHLSDSMTFCSGVPLLSFYLTILLYARGDQPQHTYVVLSNKQINLINTTPSNHYITRSFEIITFLLLVFEWGAQHGHHFIIHTALSSTPAFGTSRLMRTHMDQEYADTVPSHHHSPTSLIITLLLAAEFSATAKAAFTRA